MLRPWDCPSRMHKSIYGGCCALLIYVSHFDVVLIKLVLFLEDRLKSIRNRMTLETRFKDFNTLLFFRLTCPTDRRAFNDGPQKINRKS